MRTRPGAPRRPARRARRRRELVQLGRGQLAQLALLPRATGAAPEGSCFCLACLRSCLALAMGLAERGCPAWSFGVDCILQDCDTATGAFPNLIA